MPGSALDPVANHPLGELTFIVAGDSHFGASGMDELNEKLIRQMNDMPGKPYPSQVGGAVAAPWGVLFMGDMTDSGAPWQWSAFERQYGLTGRDGLLKYPIFEASGNHDRLMPFGPVPSHVKSRHGGLTYSWDWDGVHFACLDLYPSATNLAWLKKDLAAVGRRPVILYWHFTPEVNFSIIGEDWTAQEKTAFVEAVRQYNVIAMFCGHWHLGRQFDWCGYDLFQPGSPRHDGHTFLVVRIKDDQLSVCTWDWDSRQWEDAYVKKISR